MFRDNYFFFSLKHIPHLQSSLSISLIVNVTKSTSKNINSVLLQSRD